MHPSAAALRRIREVAPNRSAPDKARGKMFKATKLTMGNLEARGQHIHHFWILRDLPVNMQVDMRGRVIICEFEHVQQFYRLEVRHKHAFFCFVLPSIQTGRIALLL